MVGPPRVVVVEDDDDARSFIEDLFASEGYAVRSARDADEARVAVAEHSPQLLVIDIMLPRETGLSFYRDIRASGRNVPAIFITARPSDLPRIYARELGASDFFRKPFDADALLRSAARALGVPPPAGGRSAA